MENIRVRAGRRAYEQIRAGGFNLDRIGTYFGPAGGPRWLVAGGFDLTLLKEGLLGRTLPVWLVGASAGAWRFAAWLQPEAVKSYLALREAYISATYGRKDNPKTILRSLTAIIDSYIEDDALPFALTNKTYRLAILTCRMKHLVASERPWVQKAGFITELPGQCPSPLVDPSLCRARRFLLRIQTSRFLPAKRVPGPLYPAFRDQFQVRRDRLRCDPDGGRRRQGHLRRSRWNLP